MNPAVLEQVNQRTQLAFVESEGISRVESTNSAAAQRASALLIQRKRVPERRPALYAEVVGRQRFGLRPTSPANRNARNLPQRLLANAAIVRDY